MLESFEVELTRLIDTEKLGNILGVTCIPGDILCLNGDLGAGKTTLTQAIARGLKIPSEQYVTSPSYAIMHDYKGTIPLYHMDFYRLHSSDDVIELGFEEYFYLDGITVIEWSERAFDILPVARISLEIMVQDNGTRSVLFTTQDDELAERYGNALEQYGYLKKE